jgi:hypothetical protein
MMRLTLYDTDRLSSFVCGETSGDSREMQRRPDDQTCAVGPMRAYSGVVTVTRTWMG